MLVDDWLRVVDADNVYALGDCASPVTGPLPCTAQVHVTYTCIHTHRTCTGISMLNGLLNAWFQVAERQGRYLAKSLSHKPTEHSPNPNPFVFKSPGMLAYVGDYRALADTPIAKSQGKTLL